MNTSKASERTTYKKLLEVKRSVSGLTKDNKGYQYDYVSSSQVINAIREKMNEVGLFLDVAIDKARVSPFEIGKTKRVITELLLTYSWIDVDNPDDRVECQWYGQGVDDGEKGVGKAATYAEKYFLLKTFNIPTDKDDPDAHQRKPEHDTHRRLLATAKLKDDMPPRPRAMKPVPNQGPAATDVQRDAIRMAAMDDAITDEQRKLAEGVADSKELTESMAVNTVKRLNELITAAAIARGVNNG